MVFASVRPGAQLYMRRIVLLATSVLLSGCAGSGFYSYLGDTFTLPFGANPNVAPGHSETYTKVRAKSVDQPPPILFEAGDVWPSPPKAPPTLKDLQAEQAREMSSGNGGYAPLQPLPQLPGYEVPEQQQHAPNVGSTFPSGLVRTPSGQVVGTGGGMNVHTRGGTDNSSIVVPNGNGTSTVIGPNGSVTTIPTPKP